MFSPSANWRLKTFPNLPTLAVYANIFNFKENEEYAVMYIYKVIYQQTVNSVLSRGKLENALTH